MRRTNAHRRAASLPLVVLMLVAAAGCESRYSPPEPDSAPQVRYEPATTAVCNQLDTGAAAARVDLTVTVGRDADPRSYETSKGRFVSCGVYEWVAEDGRFSTGMDHFLASGLFTVSGTTSIDVYHNLTGAQDEYRTAEHNYLDRFGVRPGASAAPVLGRWDDGVLVEQVVELDPDEVRLEGFDMARLDVSYTVRHRNAVLATHAEALAPTADSDQALALLHDLADVLLAESVDQLTPTTDPPASHAG